MSNGGRSVDVHSLERRMGDGLQAVFGKGKEGLLRSAMLNLVRNCVVGMQLVLRCLPELLAW
jgi:hypothetical protein